MSHFTGLRCRMCGETYPATALYVCSECLGPLEVTYDYDSIREAVSPRRGEHARQQPLALS